MGVLLETLLSYKLHQRGKSGARTHVQGKGRRVINRGQRIHPSAPLDTSKSEQHQKRERGRSRRKRERERANSRIEYKADLECRGKGGGGGASLRHSYLKGAKETSIQAVRMGRGVPAHGKHGVPPSFPRFPSLCPLRPLCCFHSCPVVLCV
jgi:hypothetical protein